MKSSHNPSRSSSKGSSKEEEVSHKRHRKEDAIDEKTNKKQKTEAQKSISFDNAYQLISFLLSEFPEDLVSIRNLFEILDTSSKDEVTIDIDGLENDIIKQHLKFLFEKIWNKDLEYFETSDEKGFRKTTTATLSFTKEFDTICTKMLEEEELSTKQQTASNSNKKIQGPTLPSRDQKIKNEPATKVFIDDYNEKYRSKSLVDMHQAEKKKKQTSNKESDLLEKAGYLQFDREKVMTASTRKSKDQVEKFIKESSNLDSNFNKRYQTSFL